MNLFNDSADFTSPTNADSKKENTNTNTPFSKGNFNSKSPKRSVLKKSKRRDCTPDSPQHSASKLTQWNVKSEPGKENSNCFKPIQLFSEKNKYFSRKTFTLTLIEENIEEVNEKYYDYLGKQTTPQSLYQSLFCNDKESREEEKESSNQTLSKINSILLDLNNHNFKVLENSQIVIITHDLQYNETTIQDFKENFYKIEFDDCQMLGLSHEENGLYIVKSIIIFKGNLTCNSRILFSDTNHNSIAISVIELCS